MDDIIIPPETLFETVIRYGLYLGAGFQLMCLAACVLLPGKACNNGNKVKVILFGTRNALQSSSYQWNILFRRTRMKTPSQRWTPRKNQRLRRPTTVAKWTRRRGVKYDWKYTPCPIIGMMTCPQSWVYNWLSYNSYVVIKLWIWLILSLLKDKWKSYWIPVLSTFGFSHPINCTCASPCSTLFTFAIKRKGCCN